MIKSIKIGIVVLVSAMVPFFAKAQPGTKTSTMKFDEEIWDFGTIDELGGKISHTFRFKNTGSNAFVIELVTPSCGCTSPTYSKSPIRPGQTGTITVEFDPLNQPGNIRKTVSITSNGGLNKNTIHIRGEVVPRPRSTEEDYPFQASKGLRFNLLSLNYRFVQQNTAMSMTVKYINTSDKAVRFALETVPANPLLDIDAPETICAGCRGDITFTYDLTGKTKYGRMIDRIYAIIDGRREVIPFSTSAIAVDNFNGVDEKTAPVGRVSPTFYHFGDVNRGEILTHSFALSNTGERPLLVRWIEKPANVTSTLREGTRVDAGKKVDITLTMDTSEAPDGVYTRSFTMITNDPVRPLREVRMAANIK